MNDTERLQRLTTALQHVLPLLRAEVPGCRRCADPEMGPIGHEHNDHDCCWTLGFWLRAASRGILEVLDDKATASTELEDLRERCAEEARAHARHDLGLEVLKANSIGLAVRKVPLTETNEKRKDRSDV